jgi:cell wall-associated NlpC family hydrolase
MRKQLTAACCGALLTVSAADAAPTIGADPAADIVVQALALLGTPYRYGGASPEAGFDCSGLVSHVFRVVLGWQLPRRSEDMGTVGSAVPRAELRAGDLLFFDTVRRAYSHVAIYLGDGRFVHAPAGGGKVRVESLSDRYWTVRFNGARRLVAAPVQVTAVLPAQVAEAEPIRP